MVCKHVNSIQILSTTPTEHIWINQVRRVGQKRGTFRDHLIKEENFPTGDQVYEGESYKTRNGNLCLEKISGNSYLPSYRDLRCLNINTKFRKKGLH